VADDIKDFVQQHFRHLDAKLDRILASRETAALPSIESLLTGAERSVIRSEASIVQVHERMDGMQRQLDSSDSVSIAWSGALS
jgi:hypothetical protein